MKQLKITLLSLFIIAGLSNVNGQDAKNQWSFSVGTNSIDFSNASLSDVGGIFEDYFNYSDLNSFKGISRVSVTRYIDKGFSVELAAAFNTLSKGIDGSLRDASFLSYGIGAKYDLNTLGFIGETGKFDPYLSLGLSNIKIEDNVTLTLNPGVGFNYWLRNHIGLNYQASYQSSGLIGSEFKTPNTGSYFQHVIGLALRYDLRKDTDEDGVYDKEDICPETPGLIEFNGCPDTDLDGIVDADDACPDVAGLIQFNGCPDTDADGIVDAEDACPTKAGPKLNKGCPWPDTDKDGVIDKKDDCPTQAGSKLNKGCPWPDTDEDGIIDKDDSCPNEAGPASNNGCAIIPSKDFAKPSHFDVGKYAVKSEAKANLDAAIDIIKQYPDARFNIHGHTDNRGSDNRNETLSVLRAKTVKEYLVSKGIAEDRLDIEGFSYKRPIATNKTAEGRAQNRRVDLTPIE